MRKGRVAVPTCTVVRQDWYYATPGQMGGPTRRLPGKTATLSIHICKFAVPGLVSCEHRMYPYNHAAIKLTGAILSGSWIWSAQICC